MESKIITQSGQIVDLHFPDMDSIKIDDIAHALSNLCRFTGHTKNFYSVAQHSVLVSYLVPAKYALQGLLHDASEAYLGDVSSPLKHVLQNYRLLECEMQATINRVFGLPAIFHESIEWADLCALKTEVRDLFPASVSKLPVWQYLDAYSADSREILACDPALAKHLFMHRFQQLHGSTNHAII